MGLDEEIVRLGVEAYDRGLKDGAEVAIEGFEKLVAMGLVVMKPELMAEIKNVIPRILKSLAER
jgi:hypothetical protein